MTDKPKKGADRLDAARAALVEALLDDMAEKGLDWQQSWVTSVPMNGATGRVYHGRNELLLMFAMKLLGTDDPRFVTFNQAKSEGWHVKKGSKGFAIERWQEFARDRSDPSARWRPIRSAQDRRDAREDPDLELVMRPVGSWTVFNATQIEGIGEYTYPKKAVSAPQLIDSLEALSPVPVTELAGDDAYYDRLADNIVVPLREQFPDDLAMARVLLHEQAHATGAPSRLNREKGKRFGDERYAFEELVAEISSMFSASELGLGAGDASGPEPYRKRHAAYVSSWARALRGADDAVEVVMSAAGMAGAATTWLIENCFSELVPDRSPELEDRANQPLSAQREQAETVAGAPGEQASRASRGDGERA